MRKQILLVFGLVIILTNPTQAQMRPVGALSSPAVTTQELVALTQEKFPQSVTLAKKLGAEFLPTRDGKSFSVFWSPHPQAANTLPTLVSLHGSNGFAYRDFEIWQPLAQQYGFNILLVQWWFGKSSSTTDYYAPQQVYPIIESVLRQKKIVAETAFLHGFSRGSANSYAIAALDRSHGKFFKLVISNAGGAMQDYPPTKQVSAGVFGAAPYAGVDWILFCGGKDENPDRDGCPAMAKAKSWVESLGARVVLFLQDANASHGGFHMNLENAKKALETALPILKK